jgi:hypothetical protein
MKKYLLIVLTLLAVTIFSPVIAPQAFAADCNAGNSPQGQVLDGVGTTGSSCDGSGVGNLVVAVVRILSWIVGIVAVIMIIVSGFKYIVSGGDSAKITSAKNTLIYALIGVAVAVLAQILVNFAFTTANDAANPPPAKTKSKTP